MPTAMQFFEKSLNLKFSSLNRISTKLRLFDIFSMSNLSMNLVLYFTHRLNMIYCPLPLLCCQLLPRTNQLLNFGHMSKKMV